ncbi:MAG: sulfatase-like hydrolase/transferase, partial [Verrucomicrobiae bacterium]|nr:sulfatase-like hydrolase/transferase [Verrucomicrobiae bacterium]
DTNQTDSYDVAGNVLDPPPIEGEIYFGQDAVYPNSPPQYTDNGDGTVTDNQTGLTWQQVPPSAFYSWPEAQAYADSLVLAGRTDWRLPTMKELLSLADFNGSSRPEIDRPYIDDSIFTIHDPLAISTFVPASASSTKRDIDGQFWSSDAYVGRTINNDSSTFGFNFIDGRIKAYPNGVLSGPTGTAFVRCVRGNPDYGKNNFIDNGDGTVTDLATGLMWLQEDSGHWPSVGTLDWVEALDWAENLVFAGHDDWTLPDAKQLQSIVDYTRAPDADDPAKQSAAIDPIFHTSTEESWCWTSTSLGDDLFAWGIYVCFGRALAIDQTTLLPTVNAHGAGAMRSDPKTGDPSSYASGHGPQKDQVRIYNHVRPVRRISDPPSPQPSTTDAITVTISGETSAPADIQVPPLSVTFNGVAIDPAVVSRPSAQEILFDFDTSELAPGDYAVTATFASPYGIQTGTYTVHANILLLIVDDWGHDASPIDNTEPGAVLANMPVVETLAAQGLRFTRAYAQPTCSPTRASILCGRQIWQTGVGDPTEANSFSTAEITLPDAFSTMNAPHHLLSVGKWHLGGTDSGYATRGGWPEFYGINGGAVTDYFSWPKNSNGTVATSTTYSTTDQVDEASAFIEAREAANEPWFTWVAFNAPHTPFHEPPASLAPPGGYSAAAPGETTSSHQYRMMLEALDTEIGRLLEAVNPVRTHIILVGDNGTPGTVVQAPYSSAHAKDSLYNGGTHVPMVVAGPGVNVAPGSTSDAPVHVIDLFSTILEMAGIDESDVPGLAARNPLSTSIVPILSGTDSASRAMIAEAGGSDPGRAILLGSHPDYKLIIHGDPADTTDTPVF